MTQVTRKVLRGYVYPVKVKPERLPLYKHSAARQRDEVTILYNTAVKENENK